MISFFYVAGWLMVVAGLFMIYKPLGIIIAGVLLILVALVGDKREDKGAG